MNTMTTEKADRAEFSLFQHMIAHHAGKRPDSTVLYFEGEEISYATLDAHGAQVANALLASGCAAQTRVAYLGKNDSRYFEAMLGCAKANMVLSPISWRMALPEILYLLDNFDIEILLIGPEFAEYLPKIKQEITALRQTVMIGAPLGDVPGFDDWRDAHGTQAPDIKIDPNDVLIQLHTSGTTGRPKGAMLTHANMLNAVRHTETGELGAWEQTDISLVPLPLFHSAGTCWAMYALYVGAANFLTREAQPAHILDAFASAPITKAGFVPAVIQMLLEDPGFNPDNIKSLALVAYGGSPITVTLLERAMKELGCEFLQLFGMTESTTMGTTLLPEFHDTSRPELLKSCGKPVGDVDIRFIDLDGNDLPQGEIGEILLRSGAIMKGYYARPEETAEALQGGWYHTGDAGYLDREGFLFIKDRIKDMVISGGENVYPAEVEQVLAAHPAVLETGVIGVPSEKWGEDVKAFVVMRSGQSATEQELIDFAREQLAHFKCPKTVEFLDALPRNPTGKVLKTVLREPFWP